MKWCCYYNHPLSSGGWHFPFEEQLLKHTSSMLTCMVSIRDGESRPTSATYQFPASTEKEPLNMKKRANRIMREQSILLLYGITWIKDCD